MEKNYLKKVNNLQLHAKSVKYSVETKIENYVCVILEFNMCIITYHNS